MPPNKSLKKKARFGDAEDQLSESEVEPNAAVISQSPKRARGRSPKSFFPSDHISESEAEAEAEAGAEGTPSPATRRRDRPRKLPIANDNISKADNGIAVVIPKAKTPKKY